MTSLPLCKCLATTVITDIRLISTIAETCSSACVVSSIECSLILLTFLILLYNVWRVVAVSIQLASFSRFLYKRVFLMDNILRTDPYMSQLMRLWYLSHRQLAKAQASLRICAVSPEPSLFAHIKYGSREGSDQKSDT